MVSLLNMHSLATIGGIFYSSIIIYFNIFKRNNEASIIFNQKKCSYTVALLNSSFIEWMRVAPHPLLSMG
jgi:hypothetical protein